MTSGGRAGCYCKDVSPHYACYVSLADALHASLHFVCVTFPKAIYFPLPLERGWGVRLLIPLSLW